MIETDIDNKVHLNSEASKLAECADVTFRKMESSVGVYEVLKNRGFHKQIGTPIKMVDLKTVNNLLQDKGKILVLDEQGRIAAKNFI